ncbi:YfhO family protein, partial [Clostridium sp. 2-1]|uniref:YfhO family protein n=1 Tax=Clostridium sp. 2-1 TaxID=2070758 RepID=UPI0011AEEF57
SASYYKPVLQLSDRIQDSSLYRVKMEEKYFDVNLSGSLGYGSLSHYTSLTSEDFMYTMKKLGYSSYWMEVSSTGGTAFTDAVLGNRYSIVKSADVKETDEVIYSNSSYAIAKNKLSLPMGLVMNTNSIQSLASLPDTT